MIRLAFTMMLLAAGVWFVGFYRMGDKPLVGHLEEIYETPVVQHKVEALHRGIGQKLYGQVHMPVEKTTVEKQASKPKPRPMTAVEPAVIDSRPAPVAPAASGTPALKTPAHDVLTEDDRDGLNDLLSKKLVDKARTRGGRGAP